MNIIETAKLCIPWNETTFTSIITFINHHYHNNDFKNCELFLNILLKECLKKTSIENQQTLILFIMLKNLYIELRDYKKLINISKDILQRVKLLNDKTILFFIQLLSITTILINQGFLSYSLDFINLLNIKITELQINKNHDVHIELMKIHTLWYQKSKLYKEARETQIYVIETLLTKNNNNINQHIINNITNYLYLLIISNTENTYNIYYLNIFANYINEHINDTDNILPLIILLNHFDTSNKINEVYLDKLDNLIDITYNCDSTIYILYQLYKKELNKQKMKTINI